MSLGQSIRSSSQWLAGTNFIGQVLTFAFGIALARLLVPADFGMLVTIQIFTGFVSLIASGGMGQALIRAKEISEDDFYVVFSIQLATGMLIYGGFFTVAPFFADWFREPLYKDLLRISAISFLLRPFLNLHNFWLQREMRFKETSLIGLATTVIGGIASVVMAASSFGVWSLVLSGLAGAAITYFLVARLTPLRVRMHFDRRIARQHSGFGFKVILNDFVSYMRHQTANFIITKVAGAAMVGLFNKGDSLAKLPFATISGSIYQPVFRAMAAEQDNADRIKYLFFRMVSLLILYTLPIYVGLWWLAKPFITFVYGEHWAEAAIPLEILAPLGLLYCVGHPCGAALAATNRLGREVVVQTITWIIVALGCYYGLAWGLTGVAVGIVVSQIYSTAHMYLLANQVLRATAREFLAATGPGLILNVILIAVLIMVDAALPTGTREHSKAAYLTISTLAGGLAYSLGFLFLPLPSLASEAFRWKTMLRLVLRHGSI
jgi:O-antigen/teichoic acid export membrane protein